MHLWWWWWCTYGDDDDELFLRNEWMAKGVKHFFQQRPFSEVFNIVKLQHVVEWIFVAVIATPPRHRLKRVQVFNIVALLWILFAFFFWNGGGINLNSLKWSFSASITWKIEVTETVWLFQKLEGNIFYEWIWVFKIDVSKICIPMSKLT